MDDTKQKGESVNTPPAANRANFARRAGMETLSTDRVNGDGSASTMSASSIRAMTGSKV